MKIKIYQINQERDGKKVIFCNYKHIKAVYGKKIPADLYDCVFDGEVEAKNLEEVYEIFNLHHPDGYTGRSLSVSDVVEIIFERGSRFRFCDSIVFKKIKFNYGG